MKRLTILLSVLLVGLVATPALAATGPVRIGNKSLALTGTDITRTTNALVVYTPARGASTRTNQYGFEAAVVGGVVTKVENGVGNMAIPANGYVLSGHGTARTWLANNARVGVTVNVDGTAPPPAPDPTSVTVGSNSRPLNGVNISRVTNALVLYDPDKGATTGTNRYGFEATVVDGKVTRVQTGVGNMTIPSNGYVLSGHGTSATWLSANARVGVTVVLDGTSNPPGPGGNPPAPVKETRTVDGAVTCQTLTVAVNNQERTNNWKWDEPTQKWVDAWTAWTTTSTTTRPATAADCVNAVSSAPSDALLPDIRTVNLNACSNLDKVNGECFRIVNPAPLVHDFPQLEGKKLLKFPVLTMNVGAGPAEVIADRSSSSETNWKAYQTFYRPNGERQSVVTPEVKFYYAGDGHNHWHFTDFDMYWIERLDGTDLRSAEKHGYCLEDNTRASVLNGQPNVPANPVYLNATSCGKGLPQALTVIEGLSRGWGDTYPATLPDQAIDITGLPDGRYRVGVTVDDIGAVKESNESNNTATIEIQITGNTVTSYAATATGGLT